MAVEYAYSRMARAAGIEMGETHLLAEDGRRHFMTRRFERADDGDRIHMQLLGALAHLDYNDPMANSYEQAFATILTLGLAMAAIEEQFRRAAFNVMARNQDDHVKNIAFLMDRRGEWSLAPAFDLTYARNPAGVWTARHQMSVGGRREDITRDDLRALAATATMKRGRADAILDQVRSAVVRWSEFADAAGVEESQAAGVAAGHDRPLSSALGRQFRVR